MKTLTELALADLTDAQEEASDSANDGRRFDLLLSMNKVSSKPGKIGSMASEERKNCYSFQLFKLHIGRDTY